MTQIDDGGLARVDDARVAPNKSCRVRRPADLAEGGRRQVSTLCSWVFEPWRKIVPLPVTGRVDRCWDVVPAGGVSTVLLGR